MKNNFHNLLSFKLMFWKILEKIKLIRKKNTSINKDLIIGEISLPHKVEIKKITNIIIKVKKYE